MRTLRFDAVVIGSGQGGTPFARASAGHGWKTALIERRYVGGVCTNDGCTPTKTMAASAHVAALARRGEEFGVTCGQLEINFPRVVQCANDLACAGRHRIEKTLTDQKDLELLYGEAAFAAEQPDGELHRLEVRMQDGSTVQVESARIFIDTGERPHPPQLKGLDATPFFDSTSILNNCELPEHLLILGGGYIAVEFAQMFRRFGSAVTLCEQGSQLLAREDEDVAACLTAILREDGIEVLLNTAVIQVQGQAGALQIEVKCDGQPRTLKGTHLLIATGRMPNTEVLRLGRVGVALDDKGYVKVNERLETSVQGIWALGDVTGGPPYTHTSYDDFRILRANLLEGGSCSTAGRLVPYCIFTDPELGRVGLSEREAREAGHDVRVAIASMSRVARAQEMSEARGMMKAVVERGTGRILGAVILGLTGGEIITELQLAMLGGLTADQVREAIFIHPVLAEGLHVLFRSYRD